MTRTIEVARARVGEVGPLAAEYRRDASREGALDDSPLPSDGVYWIARDDAGTPLGYAAGTLRPEGFVLGPFFVRPRCRRAGVGRRLLETVERWVDAEHVRLLEVSVAADNHAGAKFLEACGYRTTRLLLSRAAAGATERA